MKLRLLALAALVSASAFAQIVEPKEMDDYGQHIDTGTSVKREPLLTNTASRTHFPRPLDQDEKFRAEAGLEDGETLGLAGYDNSVYCTIPSTTLKVNNHILTNVSVDACDLRANEPVVSLTVSTVHGAIPVLVFFSDLAIAGNAVTFAKKVPAPYGKVTAVEVTGTITGTLTYEGESATKSSLDSIQYPTLTVTSVVPSGR